MTNKRAPVLRIEPATAADVPLVLRLIRGLAAYEKLAHEVTATEERLRAALFGSPPAAHVLLGYADGEAAGFAVYFQSFSTFLGLPGLYLEDVFVVPEWRGHGLGRALIACVARVAVERGCGRLEWSVLDWNAPALRFYGRLGARSLDQWTVHRLTGEALSTLAAEAL